MPNAIKYSTTGDTLSLKKGNIFFGVGDVGKGPSSATTYYNGVTPPSGGYTIYSYNAAQTSKLSFHTAVNDASLITYTNEFSKNQTNYISNGGNFANGTISPFNNNYSDSGGVGQVVSISNDLPYVGSQSTNALYLNYNGGRWMSTVGLLTTGVTYTFSFWGKIISGSSFTVSWNNQNGSGDTNAWTSSTNLTTSWQRYTQTFTYNTAKNNFYFSSRSADTSRAAVFTEFQVTTGTTYGGPGLQNATECLRWYASIPNDAACVNRDYESIVTDGLIFNIDAGFTPSYPTSGTTWYDLAYSGNNGTLTNGPTYSTDGAGSIVFDEVDDYVTNIGTTSTFSFIQNTGIFTISAWVKLSDLSTARYFMGNNDGTTVSKGFFLGHSATSGRLWLSITYGTSGQFTLNQTKNNFFTDSNWVLVTCVGNGTNCQFYKNGISFDTPNNFGTFSTGDSSRVLGVGRFNNTSVSNYWSGNVALTQIYNRALSSTEVLQNYNAQKSRFGL